jgi:phenylalanyl-tRNA synthetase beta chain
MRLPLSWIKEYIDIDLPPHQIAKMLTMAGLEVEGVDPVELGFEGIMVATVKAVEKHPDADKLRLAEVDVNGEIYHVVCGAKNCRAGLKTAFAPIGSKLSDDEGRVFKIKKSKIRGVESQGMLCSGKELGISEDYEGIVEFDAHLSDGTLVNEMYGDIIFDIALTPNLGHCASVLGVVRELAAATGLPFKEPDCQVEEKKGESVAVDVKDFSLCPRYSCQVVKNVKMGPSPQWMQQRLLHAGHRPINVVVDITNYVLVEMGQPLHAFDLETLDGGIVVRHAQPKEALKTLDEKMRELTADDLIIADHKKPIALAGVMGGEETEVSEKTQHVLLESACFDPQAVRQMGKRHQLISDAQKRFEKGTDPNGTLAAINRAAKLIQELGCGEVFEAVDVAKGSFEELQIPCRLSRIEKIIGHHFGMNEVEVIFQRLKFPCKWDGKDTFTVSVPTYRRDISQEIDLIEEVVRIYGYDKIKSRRVNFTPSTMPTVPLFSFERKIRKLLLREGLQEFLTCDLVGPTLLSAFEGALMKEERSCRVLNPTSVEQSILRTSLLPGLLQVVKRNFGRQSFSLSGFEVGRIHFREGDGYKEQLMAGIIMTGQATPHHFESKGREVDFFDLKGALENVFKALHLPAVSFEKQELKAFHNGRQAIVSTDGLEIGAMGEVHPSILRKMGIDRRVLFAEVNLHDLFQKQNQEEMMEEIPVYPGSERDWTVTVGKDVSVAKILEAITKKPSSLLENVTLQGIYCSDKLGDNKQNLTFRFLYRSRKKTVQQEAVEKEHARLIRHVEEVLA